MNFIKTSIEGLFQVFPRLLEDHRGIFFESYNRKEFVKNGLDLNFVQDNQSFSLKGVLRGLHFQLPPFAQGKLVTVSKGLALDVAVDLRIGSKTYGKYEIFELSGTKRNMVYIPEGFAHGFLALEETILGYKCTNFYSKESESGIIWNDADLNIDWGIKNPLLSDKDAILKTFKDYTNSAKSLTFA